MRLEAVERDLRLRTVSYNRLCFPFSWWIRQEEVRPEEEEETGKLVSAGSRGKLGVISSWMGQSRQSLMSN